MYKIKRIPEDFIVREYPDMEMKLFGPYVYFWLEKKNLTTLNALKKIGKALRKPLNSFGYAGNKDKTAITAQLCSAENVSEKTLEQLKLENIKITVAGKGNRPVSLGLLKGNHFKITVRNIHTLPKTKQEFINYYGEQRFSRNNAEIGKAIIKKDFKKAVELILDTDPLEKKAVESHLRKQPAEYLGALKRLPRKILLLYVHAYQSKLWNELAGKLKEEFVPIIGFGTKTTKEIKKVLEKENLKIRDFIIKEMPHLSSEGGKRKRIVKAEKLKVGNVEDDELNKGTKKVILEFYLPKGSYATEFIRQNFSQE